MTWDELRFKYNAHPLVTPNSIGLWDEIAKQTERTDYSTCFSNYTMPIFNPDDIKKVIFNNPATIVLWMDGSKTVVKCENYEVYDPEKGLALCIAKKALGNKGNYYNAFRKHLPKEYSAPEGWMCEDVRFNVETAYRELVYTLHNRKSTKLELAMAMEKAIGYLGEVLE